MNAVFTLAGLTVKEAIRRKFVYAGLLISFAFIVLAYIPIHPHRSFLFTSDELPVLTGEIMATFGGHIAEFFAFLFAVALSAGSISNEIERGVLAVVVPKPIPRWSIYWGKWLGIQCFILPFLLFWVALLQWAIFMHIHRMLPELWQAFGTMALYPIVFTSLTMFFSSFTSYLLATILPLILASVAWSEGLLKPLGNFFNVEALKVAARVVVYAAPLNPMSRWVERMLHPDLWLELQSFRDRLQRPDPPANWIDLGWILAYAGIAFFAGQIIFQRRDL